MNKLGLAFALVMALGMIGWPSHVAVGSQHAELNGTVTVNGESPPQGVEIIAKLADGTECDRTTTEEGGSYEFALSEECPAGKLVLFFLAATEDQAVTEVTVEEGDQTAGIAFEDLSPESLQAIGLVVAAGQEAAVEVVEEAAKDALDEKFAASLLTQTGTLVILLALLVAVTFLVSVIVGAQLWSALRGVSPDGMSFLRQVEAIVLTMVIVALIILGITDKVEQQGLVAILGAIAGYGAGRSVGAATASRQ